jgi:hypothetical protein
MVIWGLGNGLSSNGYVEEILVATALALASNDP